MCQRMKPPPRRNEPAEISWSYYASSSPSIRYVEPLLDPNTEKNTWDTSSAYSATVATTYDNNANNQVPA